MNLMKRLLGAICASVTALCASPAFAQAPVDVPFFFPVAVGGPITKIIDGFAADFEKEDIWDRLQILNGKIKVSRARGGAKGL